MNLRRLGSVLLLVSLSAISNNPIEAALTQGGCSFTLGFRALQEQIPEIVGDCLENEHFEASTGNTLQRTTGGLLVWRKADNWTAFTDGATTWRGWRAVAMTSGSPGRSPGRSRSSPWGCRLLGLRRRCR